MTTAALCAVPIVVNLGRWGLELLGRLLLLWNFINQPFFCSPNFVNHVLPPARIFFLEHPVFPLRNTQISEKIPYQMPSRPI